MIYQITLPYACFSIEIEDDIVMDAAPIGKWMVGKKVDNIKHWVHKQGGFMKGWLNENDSSIERW